MKEILDAIFDPGSQPADLATLPLPEAYRAVTLHRDEEHMFDGLDPRDRDPRKSLHVEEVPVPELGLGEALIAVMASSVNYNTVSRAPARTWTVSCCPRSRTPGRSRRWTCCSPRSRRRWASRPAREVPMLLIGEGTAEIQKMIVGRRLLEEYRTDS